MKFQIKNRFTGDTQVECEIECEESESYSIKLGLAVKFAIKIGANLSIVRFDGVAIQSDTSIHNPKFLYKVGEVARCDKWEENRHIECSGGIHFT